MEKAWDFGRGLRPQSSVTELPQVLALDPKLKVLVAHGLFDRYPVFRLEDAARPVANLRRGAARETRGSSGDMFYSRDASRLFRAEVQALMK